MAYEAYEVDGPLRSTGIWPQDRLGAGERDWGMNNWVINRYL
jgi:hypothetical protein